MRLVHRREASEGHWASEGMPKTERRGRGRGRKKGGILEAEVMGAK